MKKTGMMRFIFIALALVLMTSCKESKPKTHYKYLVWVNSSGFYTQSYEIKGGLIYFEGIGGRKIIATSFEIEESKEGYYR